MSFGSSLRGLKIGKIAHKKSGSLFLKKFIF
jgi:hypothetical protein